jgi:hypothetical protein
LSLILHIHLPLILYHTSLYHASMGILHGIHTLLHSAAVETAPAVEGEVDETGIDPRHINLVTLQTKATRAQVPPLRYMTPCAISRIV